MIQVFVIIWTILTYKTHDPNGLLHGEINLRATQSTTTTTNALVARANKLVPRVRLLTWR